MKKLLTGVALCAAFIMAAGPASAQVYKNGKLWICGEGIVSAMKLFRSDSNDVPTDDCVVSIEEFNICDLTIEDYEDDVNDLIQCMTTIPTNWGFIATATGTQLNLALLKKQNNGNTFGLCVEYDLACGQCDIEIVELECIGPWHGYNP